jgi:hypothetical protein
VICIEHQKLIVECFCFCMQCKKQTITIEEFFQKYCPTCKKRLCELCNKRGNKDCDCLCKKCGRPGLVDHECRENCHACQGADMGLMGCLCGKKLCPMCFFKRMEPGEETCLKG